MNTLDTAGQERKKRNSTTHKVDLTRPLSAKKLAEADIGLHGTSCFGKMWNPEVDFCAGCHDNEMCGIVYHAEQRKKVKEFEKNNVVTLDMARFDDINKEGLFSWLAKTPRKPKEMSAKIAEKANCADMETVKHWCRSFVENDKRLSIKDGIIKVKLK